MTQEIPVSAHTRPVLRPAAGFVAVVLLAGTAIAGTAYATHDDRGNLTQRQYDLAVAAAKREVARDHWLLTAATAALVSDVQQGGGCSGGSAIVVVLSGPHIERAPVFGDGTDEPADLALMVDPESGRGCGTAFAPRGSSGSADLMPALTR